VRTIEFEEIEKIEIGNAIGFVGTVWLDSKADQFYILPVVEDLPVDMENVAIFNFSDSEKIRFLNQAWLLESSRYSDFKNKAVKTALYRSQSSIHPSLRWRVFRRDNFACCYCGYNQGELTFDHYLPKALGGFTTEENGRTACRLCNRAKGDLEPEQWENSLKLEKIRAIRKKEQK